MEEASRRASCQLGRMRFRRNCRDKCPDTPLYERQEKKRKNRKRKGDLNVRATGNGQSQSACMSDALRKCMQEGFGHLAFGQALLSASETKNKKNETKTFEPRQLGGKQAKLL